MTNQTMKAIRVHQYGGPEKLILEQVQRPRPLAKEVLVRVHAIGVLPIDWKIRSGMVKRFFPMKFPYIPGSSFAGTVEEVGSEVTSFWVGDAVFGKSTRGAYAEYTIASIDGIAHKPESMSFEEAATIQGGATTAWEALFLNGRLENGQSILIHGAAGGVGVYATQFAAWKGARVIATTSTANLDFVHSLGAETVIDYSITPFEEVVNDVDIVLDAVGGETLDRSYSVIKPGGTLITLAGQPSESKAKQLGIKAIRVINRCSNEELRAIAQLFNEGKIKTVIGDTFSLDEARLAHKQSQTGHVRAYYSSSSLK